MSQPMFIVRTLSLSSSKDAHTFQLMEIEMPGLGGNDGRANVYLSTKEGSVEKVGVEARSARAGSPS